MAMLVYQRVCENTREALKSTSLQIDLSDPLRCIEMSVFPGFRRFWGGSETVC